MCHHRRVHWVWIVLIGAGVGFLGGMFGKGGSAIATPLLAAVGVPKLIAVASPLPATVPGTLVAYRSYHGSGFSDHRIIRWSLIYGIPATVVGALITRWIGGEFLVKFTDVVVAILGVRIIVQTIRHSQTHAGPETTDTMGRLAGVAVAVGFLAGLLANAGGFLLVPLYLAVLNLPIKKALACSLAVASVLALPGTVVHAALGHVDWLVTLVFGSASIPLSGLGARTAVKMDPARLEWVYGVGLVVLGVGLFFVG